MGHAIRIMLVDDHAMILDSLRLMFGVMEGIEVVHATQDSTTVLDALDRIDVDVVVTDFKMPVLNGIQLTRLISTAHPSVNVLVLSVNEALSDVRDAYRAGAAGYLFKRAKRAELEKAIKTIYRGDHYYDKDAIRALFADQPAEHAVSPLALTQQLKALTCREREIILLLADELSSAEIASHLSISQGTVETHRHNIIKKLQVKSSIGVVRWAIKAGLID